MDNERAVAAAAFAASELPPEVPEAALPSLRRRGRGATLNPGVRFDSQQVERVDDGWGTALAEADEDGALPPLETVLTRDAAKTVLTFNQSPDIGFDRSVNPYRGCEHGCVYCYARPSHAYLGLSPGLDFETKLLWKPDVAEILAKELRKPGYVARPIALGSNTDVYQPVERTLKLTRSILSVLLEYRHPVTIVTKSTLVLRDLDLLKALAAEKLVSVMLSVTTLDGALARAMEPRASAPRLRLAAIEQLARAGVPAGVIAAPMIPGLNDAELESILEAASKAGASRAGYVLLRLPHELRALFTDWLQQHFPDRAKKVLALIRETRGGALSDARFHHRFTGVGVYADLLERRFAQGAKRHGLDAPRTGLECGKFRVPEARAAEASKQLAFL